MDSTLYMLVGTAAAGLLLYWAIVRLLQKQSVSPSEFEAVRSERDRLVAQLHAERAATAETVARAGKLSGLLEGATAESDSKSRKIDELEESMTQARARIEQETIAARTASSAVDEREKMIAQLREDAKLENEKSSERVNELTRQLESARARVEVETIAARTASRALIEKDESIAKLRETAVANDGLLDRLQTELKNLHAEHAQVRANLVHSQRAHEELKTFVDDAQSKLTAAFAELAGKVFDEKAQVFEKNVQAAGAQSKADIDLMLKPLSERLADFRLRVDALYGEEAKERAALFGAVTELKTLNQDMAAQTSALTRALKGSAKVRGDWGELMLESVLRGAGLEEGLHYDRQQSNTDEEGQRLRPDIVVRLPDERQIVVDSKVSLLAWIDATNAETPEQQSEAMRRHSVALRQHVKDLGEKNYPKALGASALEITIAFVPIEGALSAALGFDNTLQGYAFDRRVVFASPNTLMALLRVVERLWTRDKIQRRATEISDVGGKVLDALGRFLEEFDKVGARLSVAHDAFSEARKFLSESNHAVIPRARRLAVLGARGKKALHPDLQPDLVDEANEFIPEEVQGVVGNPVPAED